MQVSANVDNWWKTPPSIPQRSPNSGPVLIYRTTSAPHRKQRLFQPFSAIFAIHGAPTPLIVPIILISRLPILIAQTSTVHCQTQRKIRSFQVGVECG
jgi:hypothetical protein